METLNENDTDRSKEPESLNLVNITITEAISEESINNSEKPDIKEEMAQTNGITNSENDAKIEIPQEPTNDIDLQNDIERQPMLQDLIKKNSTKINAQIATKQLHQETKSKAFIRSQSKEQSFALMIETMQNSDGTMDITKLEKEVHDGKSYDLEVKYGFPKKELIYLINQFKKKADKNKDGKIDEEEWTDWLDKHTKQPLENHHKAGAIAQVFAYSERWTCSPPTVFILSITFLQVLFYLLTVYAPKTIGSYPYEYESGNFTGEQDYSKVIRCSCLIYSPYRRRDIWRFITYMFLHGDTYHLAWNVCFQLLVGIPLEMGQPGWKGSLRVGSLFMAGIFVGALGAGISERSKYLVGSSPGTYALIMAHLATIALNWKEDGKLAKKQSEEKGTTPYQAYLLTKIRVARLIFVIGFMLTDAGLTIKNVLQCEADGSDCKQISRAGHAFGAIVGLMVGVFVLKNRKVEDWEIKLQIAAFSVFSIFSGTLLIWHITAGLGVDWFNEGIEGVSPSCDHNDDSVQVCWTD